MTDERCQHWEVKPCCPCDWSLEHMRTDEPDGIVGAGDLVLCRHTTDGVPHRYRAGVRCNRADRPPMVPDWTHERWTGHAFAGAATDGEGE